MVLGESAGENDQPWAEQSRMRIELRPENLLAAYATGIFPMADDDGTLQWFAPDPRAIIELPTFQPSRSLRQTMKRGDITVTVDQRFESVMRCCADRADGTWISEEIIEAYCALHDLGYAHSVEAMIDDRLVGGLYGVAIGGAFFGESMFHRATDASKVALAKLVERLKDRGYILLDVQFMTDHLRRHSALEIPRKEYEQRLADALKRRCRFSDTVGPTSKEA